MANIRLQYIMFNDIKCKHCGTFNLSPQAFKMLILMDHFFARFRKSKISSWYRCPEHHLKTKETEIGRKLTDDEKKSALNSGHTQGIAVDITHPDPSEIFKNGIRFAEFSGMGLYPWGVHFDIKPRKSFWRSQGGKYQYFDSPLLVF